VRVRCGTSCAQQAKRQQPRHRRTALSAQAPSSHAVVRPAQQQRPRLLTFIVHVRRVDEFKACHDLASLAKAIVQIGRDTVFPLVYRLIELALLLPVATATVERAFSAMKIIKTELRNKMGDYWLNDLMVIYTERKLFKELDFQNIKKTFQKKKE
jgi:hypothetical protein